MSLTFIDTGKLPMSRSSDSSEFKEILNKALCGADNVVGTLYWLDGGQRLDVPGDGQAHQLIYLMEGAGTIALNSKEYDVKKGAGIYLEPSDSTSIRHKGIAPLKLFRLYVPKLQS